MDFKNITDLLSFYSCYPDIFFEEVLNVQLRLYQKLFIQFVIGKLYKSSKADAQNQKGEYK